MRAGLRSVVQSDERQQEQGSMAKWAQVTCTSEHSLNTTLFTLRSNIFSGMDQNPSKCLVCGNSFDTALSLRRHCDRGACIWSIHPVVDQEDTVLSGVTLKNFVDCALIFVSSVKKISAMASL